MSRNIKTYKCLQKHLGKTVHIVNRDGIEFDAQVGYVGEGCLILHTEDKIADTACGWWEDKEGWSHFCREDRPYQITTELKSIALVKEKKHLKIKAEIVKPKEPDKESFLTREQLLEHIGKRCKMSDGTEGLIVENSGTPRVLMKDRANDHGWLYNESCEADTGASEKVRGQYKYAWNVMNLDDARDISVVEILEDDAKEATESSKTILDMTIREVLEKLDEIIKR